LIAALRSALHYLYDPVHLRSSPLVALLGLDEKFDSASALQAHLTAAIRGLKPADEEAPQARAWRVYDLLHFQYIRQLSRAAVATQLGISERQLRREQRMALEVLAQQVLPQVDETPRPAADMDETPRATADETAQPDEATVVDQALSEELFWLKKQSAEEPIGLRAALAMVQQLVQPLADQWQVALQFTVAETLADHPVPPLLLRSILPTILSVAIPRAGPLPLTIAATQGRSRLLIRVISHARQPQAPLSEKELTSLQTAETVAAFHGAEFSAPHSATSSFVATLALPLPKQLSVLVIDDNADWLALQQRYVAGTRYQLTGTSDSLRAAALAAQVQPALILLDVMMHNVDGWQILSALRHDPATATIPIVICTILPIADLALALGANAFLQKPVTQEQFLQTLARWAG
jgi:CheY-like chemotaxis protein